MTMKKLLGISTFLLLVALIGAVPAWAEDYDYYYWNVSSGTGDADVLTNWKFNGTFQTPTVLPGYDETLRDYVCVATPGTMLINADHPFAGQIKGFYTGYDDVFSGAGHVIQSGYDIDLRHPFSVGDQALAGSSSSYVMTGGSIVQAGASSVTIGAKGSNGSMTMGEVGDVTTSNPWFNMNSGTITRIGYEDDCTGDLTMQSYSVANLGKELRIGYGIVDLIDPPGACNGTLTMKDHAQLTVGADTNSSYIGRYANGTGTFEMTGDTVATFTTNKLYIGHESGATGYFKMSGNAVATVYTAGRILVGDGGSSAGIASGTIDLRGYSKLTTQQLNVVDNEYSHGAIIVTENAELNTTGTLYIGVEGGPTGVASMTVSLNGKVDTNNKELVIGRGGTAGTVTISDDAVVTVGDYVRFGDDGEATLNLDGGTLACDLIQTRCGTDVSPTVATLNFNGGTLKAIDSNEDFINLELDSVSGVPEYATQTLNVQTGGAVIDTDGFDIGINQPLLDGTGTGTDGGLTKNGLGKLTLGGVNTYTGATAVNAGGLKVDGSITSDVTVDAVASLAGTGTITGNVDLNGTLAVDDSVAGAIDLLTVVGDLDLTGATIDFSNIGMGALADGTYLFAECTDLLSEAASISGLLSGWSVTYGYGATDTISLIVTGAPLMGDANGDGKVDAADVSIMAANWGALNATWEMGDFDNDDTVGPNDARLLAQNWGTGGNESTSAVPEPGSLALLMGIMVSIFACGRRQRLRG